MLAVFCKLFQAKEGFGAGGALIVISRSLWIHFIVFVGVRLKLIDGLILVAGYVLDLVCLLGDNVDFVDFIIDLSNLISHVHSHGLLVRTVSVSLVIALSISVVRVILIPLLRFVDLHN